MGQVRQRLEYVLSVNGQVFVFRYYEGGAADVLRRVYVASRSTPDGKTPGGFSLGYVLQAMRELG